METSVILCARYSAISVLVCSSRGKHKLDLLAWKAYHAFVRLCAWLDYNPRLHMWNDGGTDVFVVSWCQPRCIARVRVCAVVVVHRWAA